MLMLSPSFWWSPQKYPFLPRNTDAWIMWVRAICRSAFSCYHDNATYSMEQWWCGVGTLSETLGVFMGHNGLLHYSYEHAVMIMWQCRCDRNIEPDVGNIIISVTWKKKLAEVINFRNVWMCCMLLFLCHVWNYRGTSLDVTKRVHSSCCSSGSQLPASHHGGQGSIPVQVMWDLCGQSGTGAGFLRVLWFPLPILIPPTGS
jgi:hypothetical protein